MNNRRLKFIIALLLISFSLPSFSKETFEPPIEDKKSKENKEEAGGGEEKIEEEGDDGDELLKKKKDLLNKKPKEEEEKNPQEPHKDLKVEKPLEGKDSNETYVSSQTTKKGDFRTQTNLVSLLNSVEKSIVTRSISAKLKSEVKKVSSEINISKNEVNNSKSQLTVKEIQQKTISQSNIIQNDVKNKNNKKPVKKPVKVPKK